MRFLTIFAVLLICVGLLAYRFPYVLNVQDNAFRLTYLVLLLGLVSSGLVASRNLPVSRLLRDLGIWLIVLLVLSGLYVYRHQLGETKLVAGLMPHRPSVSGGLTHLEAGMDGHFYTEAYVNGTPIYFMVDTGASDIILSPDDARALGLPLQSLEYNRSYETANGRVSGADVTLDYIKIGNIQIDRMPASVNEAEMRHSLLGMSFLRRLKGFRVEGDTLTLVP